MADNCEYVVRPAKREDIHGLLKLLRGEGWLQTLEQALFQFELFPEGAFVAETSEGEIISHCGSIPLDDTTGTIYHYVTKKSSRGRGIGKKLFTLSCRAMGDRNIGLSSVWERQKMYASIGFKVSTFTLVEFITRVQDVPSAEKEPSHDGSLKLLPIKDEQVQNVLVYDTKIHSIERAKTVKWLLGFARASCVAVDGNEVKGIGVLYQVHQAYRMVLYSDTVDVARALISFLFFQVANEPDARVRIMFPEDNTDAWKLYNDLGVIDRIVTRSKRMFTKRDVPIPTQLVYSVVSDDEVLA